MNTAILLISCPDRRGITARVSDFVYRHNGNIVHADQHIDDHANTFFMRIEWSLDGFDMPADAIADAFLPVAQDYDMDWRIYFSSERPRLALFVSRHTHCLYDLLLRYREGQFNCEIPLIVSNHEQARDIADNFSIPYHVFLREDGSRRQQENNQIELLLTHNVDYIVLARYMQVLSPVFVERFSQRIINIHHSFLPAFKGGDPYRQAYGRGVKIIGATAHYVTDELDAGPIIEQDTVRVSHRDRVEDMVLKGRDLERIVLAKAVKLHLERKLLVYDNKTVVFD
jgi:formyltetrahydrofolate deformylase